MRPAKKKPARPAAALALVLFGLLFASPAAAMEATTLSSLGGDVRIADITFGSGGGLWYAGSSYSGTVHDEIGRVSPTGEVTRFPLPQHEQRFLGIGGIADGPEGNLWFTESNRYRIGRITPTGQVADFFIPVYGARPKQIVAGPDGNLWFTDAYAIVRFDPDDESVKEFDLPSGSDPAGITVGPDDAIWFAERGMGHIGRISMSGQYTRYEVPALSHPRQIVAGPDGNLWFTDEAAPRVGRITTDGQISLFPVRVEGGTEQLSSGPHGLLWFSSGPEIGTITTRGVAAPAECLYPSCALTIASLAGGPDGNLWVATDGFVGKFLPAVQVSIGRHPGRIRGRYLTLGLWCDGGILDRPCEGSLRLNGLVPRPGRAGSEPMRLLLANSRFSIPGDSGGRVRLRLRGRPFRLLTGRDRIKAWAYTSNTIVGDGPVALMLKR